MATTEFAGWVRELDDYEASMLDNDDSDPVDPRAEDPRPGASSRRGLSSRGSTAVTSRSSKAKPRTNVAEELKQEIKLLNWHKLANEAALKAAIIKTNKIKHEDSRFERSLLYEDSEDKRQRIQQIIEEEQLKPLQVNSEFFRDFEAKEARDEAKVESDVQRHIQHLKRLKETMAQREDSHRRRLRFKENIQELGGGPKSHSVPKALKSNNQEDETSVVRRQQRSSSTTQKADSVICSLDKLMELEKRIRHLEDAGLGVDGLEGDGDDAKSVMVRGDLEDNNVRSTKQLRFAKRKSNAVGAEPSKTLYAVKTKTTTRPANHLSKPTASSASKKRSLAPSGGHNQTFLTSLPESKQRQLRRMTDRERRQFLKKEKAADVREQTLKQDVVIQDWMQKKKHAAQQRKTTNVQHTQLTAASAVANGNTRRGVAKPLPPPPKVKALARGAASGKRIANPHLQQFDDMRKGFEKRRELLNKAPTNVKATNKVLDVRTTGPRGKKTPMASTLPTKRASPEDALAKALDRVKDRVIANEFDRPRQPLALVLFSNSSTVLDRVASALGTAFVHESSTASSAIQVFDAATLVDHASNYDAKQTLRKALAVTLATCPQRSVFVMRNTQHLRGQRLPVLDVFLDPMNGARGQFHDAATDRVLDTRHAVFIFLFESASLPSSTTSWREFLFQQWQISDDDKASDMLEEAFTPQAMVGRISDGIVLVGSTPVTSSTRQWRETCDLRGRLLGGQDNASWLTWLSSVPQETQWIFLGLLIVLLLLYSAKEWRKAIAAKREKKERRETPVKSQLPPRAPKHSKKQAKEAVATPVEPIASPPTPKTETNDVFKTPQTRRKKKKTAPETTPMDEATSTPSVTPMATPTTNTTPLRRSKRPKKKTT
ncbi:hypothetical protein Poli38472_012520 [Pythium oligandrum]|uniref:Uncharacterized protein n=1 Tax=Pythium oligandrum TaxID=41045 RepID=A0A8K1CDC4_PYTOL|nr:hypothetical protein Poli38472_012520 [Pythium oligandrum]|eukprot:TMW61329.1 hypothetical protein Poli38472_012520 [Pythium oligandrum]